MNKCATKYPIVLIHGIGYTDQKHPDYWGQVPDALREEGARVFFGGQSAFGPVGENALQLRDNIEELCRREHIEKVNLIAHSKGGIEARRMISLPGGAERTASLTTIATPHRGIAAIDIMKKKAPRLLSRIYSLFSTITRLAAGAAPSDESVYDQMSADYMDVFNEMIPDAPDVYYQSYACRMDNPSVDPAFAVFHRFVKKYQGENDGLIPLESAKWGEYRGAYSGPSSEGISHSMVCGNRRPPSWRKKGVDVCGFYIDMVSRLRSLGF